MTKLAKTRDRDRSEGLTVKVRPICGKEAIVVAAVNIKRRSRETFANTL
jgi:hypothetical protein